MSDELELQQRRLRLKKAVGELSSMKGMGTELVSLVIPPDKMIHDVRHQLSNEAGQAANIKSKSTRKHVSDAIESAMASLNRYKTPGERGIALFVGYVIVGNNKTRLVSVVVDDPPEPFGSYRYRCGSTFELSQLEEMLIDRTAYGLFVIDRSESAYGLASGKRLHCQEHVTSLVPSKHGRGGQSAQRFERLIEEAAHNFFKRATEHACSYWLPELDNIQAIIIGGPGATKDFVVKNDYFHHEITKKIAKTTFDVGYSNESGVRELVDNAGGLMGEIELDAERKVVTEFLEELVKQHPKATYGERMIRQALEQGAVAKLLISEGMRKNVVTIECKSCSNEWTVSIGRMDALPACSKCKADGDDLKEISSVSLIDEFSLLATKEI